MKDLNESSENIQFNIILFESYHMKPNFAIILLLRI